MSPDYRICLECDWVVGVRWHGISVEYTEDDTRRECEDGIAPCVIGGCMLFDDFGPKNCPYFLEHVIRAQEDESRLPNLLEV